MRSSASTWTACASADALVAILDGADADSGTSFECGLAYALGIPIVAVRTDFRGGGDDLPGQALPTINLMLAQAVAAAVHLPGPSVAFEVIAKAVLEVLSGLPGPAAPLQRLTIDRGPEASGPRRSRVTPAAPRRGDGGRKDIRRGRGRSGRPDQAKSSLTTSPPSTILIGRPMGLMFSLVGSIFSDVAEAGHQVGDGDRAVLDLGAVGRRGADDLAALDAAAGQGDVEDAREVVAAGVGVDLRASGRTRPSRRPASGRASPAAFRSATSVAKAGSTWPASLPMRSLSLLVRVPAVRADLDERDPRLDQPAGQQAALAERVPAVGVAERWGPRPPGRTPSSGARGPCRPSAGRAAWWSLDAVGAAGLREARVLERLQQAQPPREAVAGTGQRDVGRGLVRVLDHERLERRRPGARRRRSAPPMLTMCGRSNLGSPSSLAATQPKFGCLTVPVGA